MKSIFDLWVMSVGYFVTGGLISLFILGAAAFVVFCIVEVYDRQKKKERARGAVVENAPAAMLQDSPVPTRVTFDDEEKP